MGRVRNPPQAVGSLTALGMPGPRQPSYADPTYNWVMDQQFIPAAPDAGRRTEPELNPDFSRSVEEAMRLLLDQRPAAPRSWPPMTPWAR